MKRIPNKTAIATICYGIKGNQPIEIYDFENEWDLQNETNGKLVYKGFMKDAWHYKYSKYFDSMYRGMTVKDDTLVLYVFTKYETY